MKRVKTHWEARWTTGSTYNKLDRVETFEHKISGVAEAECRLFAQKKALELKNNGNQRDEYTRVEVYEVETHEELVAHYTNDSVLRSLSNQPKAAPPKGTDL